MRPIDVDAITDHEIIDYLGIRYASCLDDVRDMLNDQPTIEAAPVVEAEWILVSQWKDEDGVINPIYRCTACHIPNDETDRFCKHCGAKMKVGD